MLWEPQDFLMVVKNKYREIGLAEAYTNQFMCLQGWSGFYNVVLSVRIDKRDKWQSDMFWPLTFNMPYTITWYGIFLIIADFLKTPRPSAFPTHQPESALLHDACATPVVTATSLSCCGSCAWDYPHLHLATAALLLSERSFYSFLSLPLIMALNNRIFDFTSL